VIGELLDAFEACLRESRTDMSPSSVVHSQLQRTTDDGQLAAPRLRIEHFGLPTAAQLARAKTLGVMTATQPSFLYDIGDTILHHLPDALVPQCYPFRAMIEAGVTVAFSSDGPVIGDINPLLGLQSAVLRRTRDGRVIAPEQTIDVAQALWCFIAGSALVSGEAARLGRLAPGYLADLVVLSSDPLTAPVEKLLEIQVEQTFVSGHIAYEL
jgi:hypothetical protein